MIGKAGPCSGTLCQKQGLCPPPIRGASLACELGEIIAHPTASFVGIHFDLISFTAHPILENWIKII